MKRKNEILVGLLLLLGGAIAVFGSIWLVRGSLGKGYPLYARFPWGAGLKPGQPRVARDIDDLLDQHSADADIAVFRVGQ